MNGEMNKIGFNFKIRRRFIVMSATVFFDQMSEKAKEIERQKRKKKDGVVENTI